VLNQLANAIAGGMVEIFLFIIAAGVIAHLIGASVHEGIFVGALVRPFSMSSPHEDTVYSCRAFRICKTITVIRNRLCRKKLANCFLDMGVGAASLH